MDEGGPAFGGRGGWRWRCRLVATVGLGWLASGACGPDESPADPSAGESSSDSEDSSRGEDASSGGATSEGSGGGEGSSTRGAPVDFDAEIQPILNGNCLCHMQNDRGEMEAEYLTMNPGSAVANLVEAPARGAPDIARVVPGDRNGSYLWHKLNGTQRSVSGGGDAMPPLGPLAAEELELIGRWIDER